MSRSRRLHSRSSDPAAPSPPSRIGALERAGRNVPWSLLSLLFVLGAMATLIACSHWTPGEPIVGGDPECGNGILDAGETCDDGNASSGDGCSDECQLENCGNGVLDGGETCDDGNSDNSDACPDDPANGGMCLSATCGDGFVWSTDGGNETCDDGNSDNSDGCSDECQLENCGNGVLDGGETCDDGNSDNSDACPDDAANGGTCLSASCGDGFVWSTDGGNETCDDGNSDNSDACPDDAANGGMCLSAVCGDGFVDLGAEGCDDGNSDAGDGCSPLCQLEECGNGILDPGEGCDDGNIDNADSCPDGVNGVCQDATCGDAFIWSTDGGTEECDGTNVDNQSCETLGYDYGDLSCTSCSFNTSLCGIALCGLSEGFEDTVPPTDWETIQTNPRQTWMQTSTTHSGGFGAYVRNDDQHAVQAETLISKYLKCNCASMTVNFWIMGSYALSVSPSQNYDVSLWVVIGDWDGGGGGGGDDILLTDTLLFDNITSDFAWTQVAYDLPSAVGGETIRLAWQYYGLAGDRFHLDDIAITTPGCNVTPKLVQVFYDSQDPSTDDQYEWIQIYNPTSEAIDLSNYSLGWGGTDYTNGTMDLSGIIPAGGCFIVGGPNANAANGNPTYDLAQDFSVDLMDGGTASDGVALFYNSAAHIGVHTCPVDAVLYDMPNTSGGGNHLIDESCHPASWDVGDAAAGSVIRRTGVSSWTVGAPQPGICPSW